MRAVGLPFRIGSALRHARVFHPEGVVLEGDLEVLDDGLAGSSLLRPGRRAPALVRFSRGIGLPDRWPDILGVAVKVPNAYGPGRDQDLLFATAAGAGPWRRLLSPAGAYDGRPYTALLPYAVGGRRVVFGADVRIDGGSVALLPGLVEAAGDRRLTVTIVADERRVARVTPHDVLPQPKGDHVAFDPWHTGGGLEPAGVLNRIRKAAYPESRAGRGGN